MDAGHEAIGEWKGALLDGQQRVFYSYKRYWGCFTLFVGVALMVLACHLIWNDNNQLKLSSFIIHILMI